MLWLLFCLPLLFNVWQRSDSCCSCYIVYHYYYIIDRGVVHVIVILFTITVLGLTEEWFMLLVSYYLPLLFKVWQRSGWCSCFYIVYHWCLRFDRGVVHVVIAILSTITGTVLGLTEEWFMSLLYCLPLLFKCLTEEWFVLLLYCLPLLFKVWQRSGSCCCSDIVYCFCLRFDRGMVHVVDVILSTVDV
jgi:hypothetical protein